MMGNIWKAQMYQLKREKTLYIFWAICFLYILVSNFLTDATVFSDGMGSVSYYIGCRVYSSILIYAIYAFICAIFVMSMDVERNLLGQEITMGFDRRDVFKARAYATFLVIGCGVFAMEVLAPIMYAFFGGTTAKMIFYYIADILITYAMLFRLCAYAILIVVVFKTTTKIVGASIVTLIVEMAMVSMDEEGYAVTVNCLSKIGLYRCWTSVGVDGSTVLSFDWMADGATVEMVVTSLVMGTLFLLAARFFMLRDDM